MYLRDSWTQLLFTLPSAVAMINALLAGMTVAVAVVLAMGAAPLVAMVAGASLGSAALALHVAYQAHRFTQMKAAVEAAELPGACRTCGWRAMASWGRTAY